MSDLTPDQTEAVRRALADARATEPLPADVAARLDHALDGLYAERSTAAPAVASLDARRRRRNAARMLVAAAAVVVGGFGVDAMVGHDLIGSQSADNAGGSEIDRDGGVRAPVEAPSATPPDSSLGEGNTSAPGATKDLSGFLVNGLDAPLGANAFQGFLSGGDLYSLHHDSLTADATGALTVARMMEKALTVCVAPTDGESVLLVRYDGRPAALRIRKPHGNEQLVDLYYCPTGHSGRLLRTIKLSAR
jgi:hypothetical protein